MTLRRMAGSALSTIQRERKVEMHIIGFSHHYSKLHAQTHGMLISVTRVTIDERFPVHVLCYDTMYETVKGDVNKGVTHGYEFMRIPSGDYLQLIFIGDQQIPFTTYRKIPEKYKSWKNRKPRCYKRSIPYSDLIGQDFAFKFKGEKLPHIFAKQICKCEGGCVKIFD